MKPYHSKRVSCMACAAAILAASGCATTANNPKDPFEGFNRAMFAVNEGIDMVAMKPIAQVYDYAVPLPAKAGVGNFFGNIADLRNVLNNALQGKLGDAGNDLGRLLINSTVGIFGLFDVASEIVLERHDEDFGQTLAVWGWDNSDYLFWPFLGPRTVRDTGGWVVDVYTDPTWYTLNKSVAVRNSLVALPFVLWQAWAFVAPGLYQHEKRLALPVIVSSVIFFLIGMSFAYFFVFPVAFGFFAGYAPTGVQMMTDIDKYLSFVLTMFIAFGLTFEMPVVVIVLVRLRIVTI